MYSQQQYLEELNYANDRRNCDSAPEKITVYLPEEEAEVELPTKYVVCDVCQGKGSYVNPAIDCGGMSFRDEEYEDFQEEYHRGDYDVTCNRCQGNRVIKEVDWDTTPQELLKAYKAQQKELDALAREEAWERSRGC
jgi:hypothetical protein